jgi:hypothetical protein
MPIQLAFNFFDSDAPETKAAADSDRLQNLRFEGIARMIADRRAPVWTIGRVIAREMVAAIKHSKMPVRPFQRPPVDMNCRMKGLRELQKTLVESEALTKRDQLDLDGPKFKFVLGEIVRLFQQALMDAGTDSSHAQRIMVRFQDLRTENDETLRRDLDLIGAHEIKGDDMRVLPPVSHGVDWSAVSQQPCA